MLIFLDTEFTDLVESAKLISLGLVAENGATFYAETLPTLWRDEASDFVLAEVVPHLANTPETRTEIASRLTAWLEDLPDPPTQFVLDSEYDWVHVWELFDEYGSWPACLATRPVFFAPWSSENTAVQDAAEATRTAYFRERGVPEHHALNDAHALRLSYLAVLRILDGQADAPN